MRRADGGECGEDGVVLGADRRENVVHGGDEDVGDLRERVDLRLARPGGLHRAHRLDDARLGLADEDGVDHRRERQRVGEGERPAGDDERMAPVAIAP